MLWSLLSGERLQNVTIRLEQFHGRRVLEYSTLGGKQGVNLFLAATGFGAFTTWKCLTIGLYKVDWAGDTCLDYWCCNCFEAKRQLQSSQLRKLDLEHTLLRRVWDTACAASSVDLKCAKGAFDGAAYHWRTRLYWRRRGVPFPHRCERGVMAAGLFVQWVRWNIEQVQRGHYCLKVRKFEAGFLPFMREFEPLHPPVSVMPGDDELLNDH